MQSAKCKMQSAKCKVPSVKRQVSSVKSQASSVIPTEARKEAQNGFYARRSEIRNPKSEGSPLLFAPRRRVDLLLPDLILQHADLFDL